VVTSAKRAEQLGLSRERSSAAGSAGVEPAFTGTGPIEAVPKALKRPASRSTTSTGRDQTSVRRAGGGVPRELGLDEERVNVNGGAIALGHPVRRPALG